MSLIFAVLTACQSPANKESASLDSRVDLRDSDSTSFPSPCSGGWPVEDPATAIHVRVDGDDGGDGSLSAPVATLARARAISRAAGPNQTILIGEGEYPTELVLEDSGTGGTDEGIRLVGCGSSTVLSGSSEAILWIAGISATVHDLRLEGGAPALMAWHGTTLDLRRVQISGANQVGFLGDGGDTLLRVVDVEISDTRSRVVAGQEVGYGLQLSGVTLEADNLSVSDSVGIGALLNEVDFTFQDLQVTGTQSGSAGGLGRGLQLQEGSAGSLSGGLLADNADAGLFSLRSTSLVIEGVEIRNTAAALLPDGSESGDGLVLSQGSAGMDPSIFSAVLNNNIIEDNARAGILVADVTATVDGNQLSTNGLEQGGVSVFGQGSAVLSGSDASVTLLAPLTVVEDIYDVDTP